jgi:hypothetical protein
MQLKKEGMKYYDKMIDAFEEFEQSYRKGLSETKKAKPYYTKSQAFHDNNYELTTSWLIKSSSHKECLDLLKKELDNYYS